MGCTHFPYFRKILSELFPSQIQMIDGSLGVANQLKTVLEKQQLLGNNSLEITYYASGKKVKEKEKLNELLR